MCLGPLHLMECLLGGAAHKCLSRQNLALASLVPVVANPLHQVPHPRQLGPGEAPASVKCISLTFSYV